MTQEGLVAWLNTYRDLDKECRYLRRVVIKLDSRLTSRNYQLSGMPHGSGEQDKIGKSVADLVDAQAVLTVRLRDSEKAMREIIGFINRLEDVHARGILYRRYISGWSWRRIGVDMEMDHTTVMRHHDSILKKILDDATNAPKD